MRIDQLIPAYHRGDAIGDTATHMKTFFRSSGYESEIYCLDRDKGLDKDSRLFQEFPRPSQEDITILHFALPSPLTKTLIEIPSKKVLIYHNITPHVFFQDFSDEMARISRYGREELRSLASHVELALADSEYNQRELIDLGFKNALVFPLFIDFKKYRQPESRFVYELFRDGRLNILFVGRIVPNKKIEDLIRVVFYYKKYISPMVRLIVAGKTSSLPAYFQSLIRMADEFYLKPDEICFTGHIPDEELYALYKSSDVFLSLSEHEGFGLPFIESMIFDLPIVAYDCTAVPYTLGSAGILIRDKRVDYIAELLETINKNVKIRKDILSGQRNRLQQFQEQGLNSFLRQNMENLLRKD